MKRRIIVLALALVCVVTPAFADFWDPYMASGVSLGASVSTDYAFTAIDWKLSMDLDAKIGGFISPDLRLYALVGARMPLRSGVIATSLYAYQSDPGLTAAALGFGMDWHMDDGWTLGFSAAARIDVDTETLMNVEESGLSIGAEFKLLPTWILTTTREWLAVSLSFPVTVTADTHGASIGAGIGISMEINDHAVNW